MADFGRRLKFHQRAIARDAAPGNFAQSKATLDKMFKQKKTGQALHKFKKEQNLQAKNSFIIFREDTRCFIQHGHVMNIVLFLNRPHRLCTMIHFS